MNQQMTTHVQVKAARIPDRDRLLEALREEGLDAEARDELEPSCRDVQHQGMFAP